ncbi:MAG: site-specific DNA-methyltransferase [Defluviitaleaceae bacterium]|nr:site-specific DNA-methyltransferase [Defluviitaleaceae bacterium]
MNQLIDHNFTGSRIIHGDTFEVLKSLPDALFSGVITDPPYASGAADQNGKAKPTSAKYSSVKSANPLPDFEGDSKDQRSWTHWMTEWLLEARRCSKPGAPICMFIDWRQLPSMTDALQWAGWIWRGILVWDKTNSRPQRGRFRQQAEFIVWGSNGHMPLDRNAPILPGVFRQTMPAFSKRIHQTEKPLEVMRDIVKIVERGADGADCAGSLDATSTAPSIILDPFAGAGTTVLAALLEGYSSIGIELSKHYADAATARIETALSGTADSDSDMGVTDAGETDAA